MVIATLSSQRPGCDTTPSRRDKRDKPNVARHVVAPCARALDEQSVTVTVLARSIKKCRPDFFWLHIRKTTPLPLMPLHVSLSCTCKHDAEMYIPMTTLSDLASAIDFKPKYPLYDYSPDEYCNKKCLHASNSTGHATSATYSTNGPGGQFKNVPKQDLNGRWP